MHPFHIEEPEKEIRESRKVKDLSIRVNGIMTEVTIKRYRSRLLAVSNSYPGRILGHADYINTPSYADLISHVSDGEELNFLRVEPEFFGHRIGTSLLETAIETAERQGKKRFLVRPERPGEAETREGEMTEKERDRLFPMPTESLRTFYHDRGFRELTEKEFDKYFLFLNAFYISGSPDTNKWPRIPEPEFRDGWKDSILRTLYTRGLHGSLPGGREAVRARIPWNRYRQEEEAMKEENIRSCENYRYLKGYLIMELPRACPVGNGGNLHTGNIKGTTNKL